MDNKKTVVKKVQLLKNQAELMDKLKDTFKHEPLFAYDLNQSEIRHLFYNVNQFFEAWYCGYYYIDDIENNKLSFF